MGGWNGKVNERIDNERNIWAGEEGRGGCMGVGSLLCDAGVEWSRVE